MPATAQMGPSYSSASRLFSRTRPITWNEAKTRAAQFLFQRIALGRYYAGVRHRPKLVNSESVDQARFYFSTEDLRGITSSLRESMASRVEQIIESAEEVSQHRFRLLGHGPVVYGSPVDWHADAVHGKRAPFVAGFQVPFLDFATVGDHKVTWELNRHQHLITLAKAWALTKETRYVTELIAQWHSWRLANPYPMGINWASSLEIAFRSLSWLWVQAILAPCPEYPREFAAEMTECLSIHARHIERNLSTYFSPNTHLLGEAVALFAIGVLCPQVRRAGNWRSLGFQIVLREAERQVRADGSYFEQSLYYHVYALDLFLHFRLLALRNDVSIPQSFDAVLNGMLDLLRMLSCAGAPEGFGDDDGGRVFDPARNRAEHLADPLAIGGLLFGREDLISCAELTEEAVWLFGALAAERLPKRRTLAILPTSSAFENAGIYISTSSERCPVQIIVDAGGMGFGRGGHGHADALSVTLCSNGRRWLVDPGTYSYPNQESRNWFRSTTAHNTLSVDDVDQAEPTGPFSWHAKTETRVEQWVVGKTFTLLAARHSGYLRLPDPVLHRRFVFHLHGCFCLIRDLIQGRKTHDLKLHWHLAPESRVAKKDGTFVASVSDRVNWDAIALVFSEPSPWKHEILTGDVSPVYGSKTSAPVVTLSTRATLPTECGMIIRPLLNESSTPGTLKHLRSVAYEPSSYVHAYEYETLGTTYFVAFSEASRTWTLNGWDSDAKFLCCATQCGEVKQLILCDGSFVNFAGRSIHSHQGKVQRYERVQQQGRMLVFDSDRQTERPGGPGCDGLFSAHAEQIRS